MSNLNPIFMVPSENHDFKLLEAHNTLGSFNPANLMIKFNLADDQINPKSLIKNPGKILKKIPTYILVHELAHFFQAAATSYGIRSLLFWIDSFTLKFSILHELVDINKGELKIPVLENLPDVSEIGENLIKNLVDYTRLTAKRLYHSGGWHLKPEILVNSTSLSNPLYHKDYQFFGHKIPLLLFDLRQSDKTDRISVFGGLHICEGISKAIDLIQARLKRKGAIRAYHPHDRRIKNLKIKDFPQLFDPYFLSNSIYSAIINSIPGCEEDSCLEEFIAISDLSLMCDNWILNFENLYDVSSRSFSKGIKEVEKIDFSPATQFIHFLNTFVQIWKKIKRLSGNFSQKDVYEFQNELIETSGGMPLDSIVRRLESNMVNIFSSLKGRCPIPEKILNLFENIYIKSFEFRREVLQNGALITDLLTSDQHIYNFFLDFSPAFVVGSYIRSSIEGYHPEVGIGVELERYRHMHELTDIFMMGDNTCPSHIERPRICQAKPSSSCKSAPKITRKKPACVREEAYNILSAAFNIKKLKIAK